MVPRRRRIQVKGYRAEVGNARGYNQELASPFNGGGCS